MFVIGNMVLAIAKVADALLTVYFWVVVASVVISWVSPNSYHPAVRAVYRFTEPAFYRIRKWLPFTLVGNIDFSPMVLMIIVQLLNTIIVQSLYELALRLA
ncbi:MAG: YggT family protein [Pseudomonadota bacterium]